MPPRPRTWVILIGSTKLQACARHRLYSSSVRPAATDYDSRCRRGQQHLGVVQGNGESWLPQAAPAAQPPACTGLRAVLYARAPWSEAPPTLTAVLVELLGISSSWSRSTRHSRESSSTLPSATPAVAVAASSVWTEAWSSIRPSGSCADEEGVDEDVVFVL